MSETQPGVQNTQQKFADERPEKNQDVEMFLEVTSSW